MKFDLQITISRLVALIMIVLGFVLSFILKDSTAFVTACTSAGIVIAIKTGFTAYGEAKNKNSSESSTTRTTTETEIIKES